MRYLAANKLRLGILLLILVAAGGIFWLLSYGGPTDIDNIVLISIDTCRADYLSCYGYPGKTTPNIDALARKGVLFEQTISPVPTTLPAHCSMLTGTIPPYHGVHDNIDYKLGESKITLAEIMSQHGYRTAAIVSTAVLEAQYGLDQGFAEYLGEFTPSFEGDSHAEQKGKETTRLACDWLDKNYRDPFFLFLHYYDSHDPYEPPEPFASQFPRNPYAGEVAYVDHCIGQVIDKLKKQGLYDSTLIIIVGDHGEMLGEHGESSHSYFVYHSAIRVPLIFKLPGQSKKRTIKEAVGIIDIMPTILRLVDIPIPAHVEGQELSGYLEGDGSETKPRYIYTESLLATEYECNPLLAVVNWPWKYIYTTRDELYNVREDPAEKNNLVDQQPKRARQLQDHLKLILDEQLRENQSDSKHTLDQASLDKLRSLGYVGDGVEESFKLDENKTDAKDFINLHERKKIVMGWILHKQYPQAREGITQLLAEYPEIPFLHGLAGRVSFETGQLETAIAHCRRSLELDQDNINARDNLGVCLYTLGKYNQALDHWKYLVRLKPDDPNFEQKISMALVQLDQPDQAKKHLDKALEFNPDDPELHNLMGIILSKQGRSEDAVQQYQRTLQLDPGNYQVHANISQNLVNQGKYEEAIEHYTKQLGFNPDDADGHLGLAMALVRVDRIDEAVKHYNETLRLKPDNSSALSNLGTALYKLGKANLAIEKWQQVLKLEPDNSKVRKDLAVAFHEKGNLNEAVALWEQAVQINPDDYQARQDLAMLLYQQGKIKDAVSHWRRTLQIKPDLLDSLNNLAWILATDNSPEIYDPAAAVGYALRVCEVTSYSQPGFLDTLAAAYAAVGNFVQAVETATLAVEMSREKGLDSTADKIQKRLDLYKQRKAYRE